MIDPRQRYTERMIEELGEGSVFAAVGQIILRLKIECGELGPDDYIDLEPADMINWLQRCTLGQLKIVRKMAEEIEVSVH